MKIHGKNKNYRRDRILKTTKKWTKAFLLMLALLLMPVMSAQADGAAQQADNVTVAKAYTGWVESGGHRYYFRNGVKLTGWQTIAGNRYYFDKNGRAASGWQVLGGQRYYFNSYGRAMTGWQTISGYRYYLNAYGRALSGWQTIGGYRFYLNGYGRAMTGWQILGGYRYYLNGYGRAMTGWQNLGGYRYYLNQYGRALTGFQKIGNYRYYLNAYGRALTGWQTLNGQRYYFYSDGRAATGTLTLNGTRYTFNSYGRVLSSTSANPVTRRAVVIGQTNYYPYASNLTACKYDAQAMASMLKKTGYSSVSTYYDAKVATMQSAISSKFASADSNDVSLFYYSGHGSSDGSLCSVDGYTISTSTLAGWLKKVPGTVIVILDSCFSGAVINKSADGTVTVKSAKEFNDNVISAFAKVNSITKAGEMCTSKFQVLTACTKSQYSYASSSYSLFTNLLVKGAGFNYSGTKLSSAPADSNSDSKLSLYECWRYTYLGTNDQDAQYYPSSSTFTLFTR